ncbi:MAG: branched-chain amino acid ABC transporter substrate-binding protein [Chloroflexi bacterium]|nr:branched-chain amino acid ABC transporter substrate-binding protein [Chloroflexota bacterium]
MLALLRSPWTWGVGLAVVVAVVVVVATSGGDDEAESVIGDVPHSPDTPIVVPAGEPIIIGVSGPLSGPTEIFGIEFSEAAAVGVELWKAKTGDTLLLGHEIEVHAEDDGCFDADITARAAGHLLYGNDGHHLLPGLVGVIGPMCSDGASRVIPVYAQAGIVMISGSATRSDLTTGQTAPEFFFRTAYSNSQEGALQARYIIDELGAATAYVIDSGERYGTDLANSLQARLRGGGVEVTREAIAGGDVDFSELAGRIASDDPDVVVFAGFNPEGALLYRQLRDAGYGGTFLGGDGLVSVSDFIEPLGELAEGAVFAGCSLTLPEEFLSEYVSIIGSEPETPFPAQLVDAVTVLLDALAQVAQEQADGSLLIDPLELRATVAAVELAGVSGAVAFDENGDRVGEGADVGLVMCRVEGGRFVNFDF